MSCVMSVVFPRCWQILLSFLVLLLAACGGSAPVPVVKAWVRLR